MSHRQNRVKQRVVLGIFYNTNWRKKCVLFITVVLSSRMFALINCSARKGIEYVDTNLIAINSTVVCRRKPTERCVTLEIVTRANVIIYHSCIRVYYLCAAREMYPFTFS